METPIAEIQDLQGEIPAIPKYCLTPENLILPSEANASNPKKITAKSARKSVHFSAIVSKIPRSSLNKQSTKTNVRKSLAFLPRSSVAVKKSGYDPRKSTFATSRVSHSSNMMKSTAVKKQSFPRASLAPKRSKSIAVSNKKSNILPSTKKDSNLKRLEHLLQPASNLKSYQRHTISSAAKVRPNHLTPSKPQVEAAAQASKNANRRATLVVTRNKTRQSEKIPFRLF